MTGLSGYTQGANVSAMTTELNSLSSSAYSAAGPAQDNAANHDAWADFLLTCTFAIAPTAGTTLDLFLLIALDGTTGVFSDSVSGSAGFAQLSLKVGSFQVRAVTTAQNLHLRSALLPPGAWRPVLFNNGTGQGLAPTGNTLVYRSYKTG